MKTGTTIGVMTLAVVVLVAFSFFATTYLAMIAAGAIGHLSNSEWLRQLSFWECTPVWMVIVLIRFLLK